MRTLPSGHTVIRADQFDPDCWQLPELTELCQNNDEGRATNYMSVIARVRQRPSCTNDNTPAGDNDAAFTRSRRPRQQTTSNGDGLTSSHSTNPPTSPPRLKSGNQTHGAFQHHERDIWTSSRCDLSRRGSTVWNTVDAHCMLYVRCAAFFDTLSRKFLMLIPTGRSENIRLALRRREQREMKNKKSNVANLLEAQQVRGKSPTERQPWNPVEEDSEGLRSSTDCDPEGRQRSDVLRMCGNRR